MCTLSAWFGVHPRWPLVVAANRDEILSRHGTAPLVLNDHPRVVGGRDPQRGGTWLGATARGFFVGITNQRGRVSEVRPRSRGAVVLEALRRDSVEGVEALLRELDADDYSPFNLLFGDARGLRVGYARAGKPVELLALDPGLHVLANDVIGAEDFPRTRRAAELLPPEALRAMDEPEALAGLTALLADHEPPPAGWAPHDAETGFFPAEMYSLLQRVCVHAPGYGTVSSTVLLLRDGGVDRYLFADGKPCVTPFTDVTPLLA